MRVVVVAIDLSQIALRVAKKKRPSLSRVCGARGIPLFARLVLLLLIQVQNKCLAETVIILIS